MGCVGDRPLAATRTNRETEIKLPVDDPVAAVKQLRELGAMVYGRVFEQNTLYDSPDAALRRRGYLLRLRMETPAASSFATAGARNAVLTFKAPPASERRRGRRLVHEPRYKERLEREVNIRNSERWNYILRLLGFVAGFRYEKYRTGFRLFQ